MRISKFKLVKEGYEGIVVSGTERKIKGNITINIEADNIRYKVPMPGDLIGLIQRLKKYFLELAGYWEERFDPYHEKGIITTDIRTDENAADCARARWLFDNTFITGLAESSGRWIITGTIGNMYNKKIGIATPAIGPDDDYPSFVKLRTGCHSIAEAVNKWLEERQMRLMDSRQVMMRLFDDDPERCEEIADMTDAKVNELAMKHLEKQGAIVMLEGEYADATEKQTTIKEKSKSIADLVPEEQDNKEKSMGIPATGKPAKPK